MLSDSKAAAVFLHAKFTKKKKACWQLLTSHILCKSIANSVLTIFFVPENNV